MDGIIEKFQRDAERAPDRVLYNFLDCAQEPFGERPVTVGEAWRRACSFAAGLRQRGARPGDRAVILSMQDEGTVRAVWGCLLAGVCFTLIPPPLDEGKLSRFISVLKSARPKFLISNAAREAQSGRGLLGKLLRRAFLQVVSLKRLYTDQMPTPEQGGDPVSHEAEDVVYLQYTSGSTSAPKGVMVTYGSLMSCVAQCRELIEFTKGRQVLASWAPFFHNIGLVVSIFLPLIADQGTALLIPTMQFLADPAVWLKVVHRFKANITAAPNSAYEAATRIFTPEQARQYDLSHVTHFVNGSEYVSARTVDKFCALFGVSHNAFAPGYGLSECVCIGTLSSQDYRVQQVDPAAYRQGRFVPVESGKSVVSVGRPARDMRIEAVREDGGLCGPGEIGEIYIQGPSLCAGYWQNPKDSQAFHARIQGLDGDFYRTGDMGILQDGCLYLTGRIKEMLIINGKNIFPNDIVLLFGEKGAPLALDAVTAFAVSGETGERPILCAECEEGTDFRALASQLSRLTAQHFGFSFADVVFLRPGSLPRTDNRKVQVSATRAAYEDGRLDVLYSTAEQGRAELHAERVQEEPFNLGEGATPEDLVPHVRRVFQELLPAAVLDDGESFLAMGGDSLGMMELVCRLDEGLHIRADVRRIAAAPTVRDISLYLSDLLNGRIEEESVDLRAECSLAEDIRPQGEATPPADCRSIFLTGATGFLGAYLIRSFIRRGDAGLRIFCHVRAADPEKGMERVVANMKRFNCWEPSFAEHLEIVCGSLDRPRLGMDDATWERLSQEADMVCHNGAILNFIFPYGQMRGTNVLGTAECLRFACAGRPKVFHYVSSYSVYDTPDQFRRTVLEDDPLASPDGYFLGYSETKWVAEKMVGIAAERGLKTAVYRPGDITGAVRDGGIWKMEDLISRSIVGCIQLGCAPDIDVNLHLTPVDYVSDAIAAIALQNGCVGRAFNLINRRLMPLGQVIEVMRKAGYNVETVPYDLWRQRLTACTGGENVLRILSCLFTDQRGEGEGLAERFGANQPQFDTANADRLLKDTGIVCPPVDETMLRSYLHCFASGGYLPAR